MRTANQDRLLGCSPVFHLRPNTPPDPTQPFPPEYLLPDSTCVSSRHATEFQLWIAISLQQIEDFSNAFPAETGHKRRQKNERETRLAEAPPAPLPKRLWTAKLNKSGMSGTLTSRTVANPAISPLPKSCPTWNCGGRVSARQSHRLRTLAWVQICGRELHVPRN